MQHLVLQAPSLQQLASVKIVTSLWSQRRIYPESFDARLFDYGIENKPEWKEIEEKVRSNVWALPLSEPCKTELLKVIKPIGIELIAWCRYHDNVDSSSTFQMVNTLLPPQLCWTMHGTVDYAKTAALMVQDEGLDIERRYISACINCVEADAHQLIQRMSRDRKERLMNGIGGDEGNIQNPLVAYFTCILSGNKDQLIEYFRQFIESGHESINEHLFKRSIIKCGSRATCEYFFDKLNAIQKGNVLSEIDAIDLGTVEWRTFNLLYYWSLLNEEQQERVFRNNTSSILESLLNWPKQPLLMDAAKSAFQFMDNYGCNSLLLHRITRKICRDDKDYDYSYLFWECWRLTPDDAKQRFLSDVLNLEHLLQTKEQKIIELVLNEAPAPSKLHLLRLCQTKVQQILVESAISEEFLEECIVKATVESSKDEENQKKRLWNQELSELVHHTLRDRNRK